MCVVGPLWFVLLVTFLWWVFNRKKEELIYQKKPPTVNYGTNQTTLLCPNCGGNVVPQFQPINSTISRLCPVCVYNFDFEFITKTKIKAIKAKPKPPTKTETIFTISILILIIVFTLFYITRDDPYYQKHKPTFLPDVVENSATSENISSKEAVEVDDKVYLECFYCRKTHTEWTKVKEIENNRIQYECNVCRSKRSIRKVD